MDLDLEADEDDDEGLAGAMKRVKVETLVHQYLEAQQLQVIAENGMSAAVDLFVSSDSNAIKESV